MSRPDHSNRRGSLPTSGVGVCRALPSREESSRSGERPDRRGTSERCRPSAPAVTPRRTAQLLPARSVIDRSSLRLIDGTERADELKQIRYLFQALFVRSIIQLVNGEEQIWMLESGPRNRVHIWSALGEDDEDIENNEEEEDEE